MHPERLRLIADVYRGKLICRASSTATLGNHLRIAHYFDLTIEAHNVCYGQVLVGEVIDDVIDCVFESVGTYAPLGYALCEEIKELVAH